MRLDMRVIHCKANIQPLPWVETPSLLLNIFSLLLLLKILIRWAWLSCHLHCLSSIYMLVDSENQKFAIYIFSVAAVLGLSHQEKALISWTHLTPTIPSDASPYSANKGTPSLCPQIQLLTNWFIWAKKSFLLVEKSCSIPKSPSSFSSVVIVSSWVHLPSLYKDRHSETNFQFF